MASQELALPEGRTTRGALVIRNSGEWARKNGHLGDIHDIEDSYDDDIDELLS
jgi:hypothetical protein